MIKFSVQNSALNDILNAFWWAFYYIFMYTNISLTNIYIIYLTNIYSHLQIFLKKREITFFQKLYFEQTDSWYLVLITVSLLSLWQDWQKYVEKYEGKSEIYQKHFLIFILKAFYCVANNWSWKLFT